VTVRPLPARCHVAVPPPEQRAKGLRPPSPHAAIEEARRHGARAGHRRRTGRRLDNRSQTGIPRLSDRKSLSGPPGRRPGVLELNTNHFLKRLESSQESRKVTLEYFKKHILIKNSERSRRDVKKYLKKFNLLEWRCSDCGNDGTWNNKKLNLQLEHKNGVCNDNSIENLCFLSDRKSLSGPPGRRPGV